MPRAIRACPPKERLHELFSYDARAGLLCWQQPGPGRTIGRPAGRVDTSSYRRVMIDYTSYQHHRLVWTYHNEDPCSMLVDHINGDRRDDRIENLRLATDSQNRRNSGMFCSNTSGYKGVTWDKNWKKWKAYIYVKNRRIHLGAFNTPEEAAAAYAIAAQQHHGEFAGLRT